MRKTMMVMMLGMTMIATAGVRAQGTLDDGQILALFDEANTTDIWMARVALSKSRSADVRRLATMVIADHEAVQQTARELARTLHLTAAPPADDVSAARLAAAVHELQATGKDDFDRTYIARELVFHRSAIDAVRGTLLPAARHAELKALLKNALGGFEHHLAETRRVGETLGVR